ncbi:dipeptidylpeptidase 8 [Pelomyxa schiedti]|nr:dipeptidylpeptidase 8 [Pelomyxa schiedti]
MSGGKWNKGNEYAAKAKRCLGGRARGSTPEKFVFVHNGAEAPPSDNPASAAVATSPASRAAQCGGLFFLGDDGQGGEARIRGAVIPPAVLGSQGVLPLSGGGTQSLPELKWNVDLGAGMGGDLGPRKLSREEILLRERMRAAACGLTDYCYQQEGKSFVFSSNGEIVVSTLSGPSQESHCRLVGSPGENARMDPKLSPDCCLVSYTSKGDIWVHHLDQEQPVRITSSNSDGSGLISAGEAKFIIQEEFDQFTAYWWSPVVKTKPNGIKEYEILFLEENESAVHKFCINTEDYTGTVEEYRYPLAGTPNTTVRIGLVRISVTPTGQVTLALAPHFLQGNLGRYSWVEYIPRAGWFPSGEEVWAQLLDRAQQRIVLVSISTGNFTSGTTPTVCELWSETSELWINISHIMHPMKDNRVIWSSEKTGFRQLYLLTPNGNCRQLTGHTSKQEWQVDSDFVFVDEQHQVVYFSGTCDNLLQHHLYAASFAPGADTMSVVRLTIEGYHHENISVDTQLGLAISIQSSKSEQQHSYIYSLHFEPHSLLPSATVIARLWCPRQSPTFPDDLTIPKLFNFATNHHGFKLYGCYFAPKNLDNNKRYPCIVHIYGGPLVQSVNDSFATTNQSFFQLYASLGYFVVCIDNVGSCNRGLAFEGLIKYKMGSVEIPDQVAGVEYLISQGIPIDRDRIGIFGWSYGGYASAMALCQRPDFFKVAIVIAPVTLWEAYDTGYTERYMGLPSEQAPNYKNASVITHATGFPSQEGRLMLCHGLQDENVHFAHTSRLISVLNANAIPYKLLVFPSERHGVCGYANRVFLEGEILRFFTQHL